MTWHDYREHERDERSWKRGAGKRCCKGILERGAGKECWKVILESDAEKGVLQSCAGKGCWKGALKRAAGKGYEKRLLEWGAGKDVLERSVRKGCWKIGLLENRTLERNDGTICCNRSLQRGARKGGGQWCLKGVLETACAGRRC